MKAVTLTLIKFYIFSVMTLVVPDRFHYMYTDTGLLSTCFISDFHFKRSKLKQFSLYKFAEYVMWKGHTVFLVDV